MYCSSSVIYIQGGAIRYSLCLLKWGLELLLDISGLPGACSRPLYRNLQTGLPVCRFSRRNNALYSTLIRVLPSITVNSRRYGKPIRSSPTCLVTSTCYLCLRLCCLYTTQRILRYILPWIFLYSVQFAPATGLISYPYRCWVSPICADRQQLF